MIFDLRLTIFDLEAEPVIPAKYVFSHGRTIPIPIMTIGMRLPPNRIDVKWVAASKPQALGMVVNTRGRLNTYPAKAGIYNY